MELENSKNFNLMQALDGTIISLPSWLEHLRPVVHLVFFETPIVTQLRSQSGINFLKVWCDSEGKTNRYVLFTVSQAILEAYRRQHITLQEMMTHPQDGFFYFTDEFQNEVVVTIVNRSSIPKSYVPHSASLFDPADMAEAQESPTYEIALDNGLDLEELQNLPHKFSQAYALLLCITDWAAVNAKKVKLAFDAYPWRGGFSRVHFYNHLEQIIPKPLRPQIKSMHFASPGWIELELDKKTAIGIGELVKNYIENADEITDLVKIVNHDLSNRKLRGNEAKSITDNISRSDLEYCAKAFDDVAKSLHFENAQLIRELAINDLAAIKILLSFQRRIASLAIFQMQDKAHF